MPLITRPCADGQHEWQIDYSTGGDGAESCRRCHFHLEDIHHPQRPDDGMSFKTNFKHQQPSRLDARKAKRIAAEKAERDCYRAVDRRDGNVCRVCKKTCGGIGLEAAKHHHHLVFRSKTSDPHQTTNVVTVCAACHDAIHVKRTLHLEGDADARDAVSGRLGGVKVERVTEGGWTVVAFV